MLINAFNNIRRIPLPEKEGVGGFSDLRKVAAFEIGTGNRAVKADQSGIWLGANKFANAPFSVDMEGNVIASSAIFSGYIEEGDAAADVNAGAVTISGGKITAGSITADRMDVATLSAISANIGTITAGSITGITITGSLFRTASSGARIEIDKDLFLGFPAIQFIHSGATYATIYMGAANTLYLNAVRFLFAGDVEASEIRPTGDVKLNNTKSVSFKDTGGGTGGVMWYDGNNDLQIKNYDDGSHLYLFTTGAGKVKINNVTKEAIVSTSDGYKALYCIESPEVWFMDFCESKDKIDPIFLEGTEGEMKFIKVEGGGYQVWRRRKGFLNTRLEERTQKEYNKNNRFWATPRLN